MIDLFSLGLTHALLMLAAWRIVRRPDLDREAAETPTATAPAATPRPRWGSRPRA